MGGLLLSSRTLLRAICSSIFNTITEQAPFAIEDLMKELRAAASSDSGQSSEEEDGQMDVKRPQMNGSSAGGRQSAEC